MQLEKRWKTMEADKTVLDRAGVIEVGDALNGIWLEFSALIARLPSNVCHQCAQRISRPTRLRSGSRQRLLMSLEWMV